MTEIDNNSILQKPSGLSKTERLPLEYFILPLCLSFQTPLFFFGFIIGTLAAITDPISPQWMGFDEMNFIARIILLIGFVGMCYRQEWALSLIAGVQIICTLWVITAIFQSGPDEFFLLWCVYVTYEMLIITACFFALWQCVRFRKTPIHTLNTG